MNGDQPQVNPYLINTYAKAPSRITRTSQKQAYQGLMPKRISELSPSVIFQDADTTNSIPPEHSSPQKQEREDNHLHEQTQKQQSQAQSGQTNTLGLISNAFMGATTKYHKVSGPGPITTPTKNETDDLSPTYKRSETNSQVSSTKFARKREQKTQPEMEHLTINQGEKSDRTPAETPRTDRSHNESRKIQRKSERGKLLKFMDKKDTEGSQMDGHHPQESTITKETTSHLTQPQQPLQHTYKPIQRHPGVTPRTKLNSDRSTLPVPADTNPQTQNTSTQEEKNEVLVNTPTKGPIQRKSYPARGGRTSTQPQEPEVKEVQIPSVNSSSVRPSRSPRPSETPSKSEIEQPEKIVLKKSVVIFFVLRRLFSQNITNSFTNLKTISCIQSKHEKTEGTLLLISCKSICENKIQNLLHLGFGKLKHYFSTNLIKEIKSVPNKNTVNPKNIGLQLIQKLFQCKLRECLHKLSEKSFLLNNKMKSMSILDTFGKRKDRSFVREGLNKLRGKARIRFNILKSMTEINACLVREGLKEGLRMMRSILPKDQPIPSAPPASVPTRTPKGSFVSRVSESHPVADRQEEKEQKLKTITKSIQQGISMLQKEISSVKKQNIATQKQYSTKISDQKLQNSEIQKELINKKDFNQKITKDILSYKHENNIQEELELQHVNKLDILSQIYVTYHRNHSETINLDDLIAEFRIEFTRNPLGQQWTLFNHNLQLRQQVERYEGVHYPQSKAKQTIQHEQEMAARLVSSYVREQYFWQWLHVSVENL